MRVLVAFLLVGFNIMAINPLKESIAEYDAITKKAREILLVFDKIESIAKREKRFELITHLGCKIILEVEYKNEIDNDLMNVGNGTISHVNILDFEIIGSNDKACSRVDE